MVPAKFATFRPDTRVLDKFIAWIERFETQHARNWARLYNADPEAAMCEAMFWGVLTDCGVTVEPNADLGGLKKAPDFVCSKGGRKFYVEVTCILIDTATEHSSLPSASEPGARHYHHLNDAIFAEVTSKTPQCSNLDAPCVLAVGTFHYHASISCIRKTFVEWLLTGETNIGWYFDPSLGTAVGEPFQATNFKRAAFLKPSPLIGVEPARKPISALIVAGFGCKPPQVYGAIHPHPVREFEPDQLDLIPFCRVKYDILNASVTTEWTRNPGPEGPE
ncbi:MAG: hypothetical protein AMXMBFR13_44230 [Phycisphaerae bacterium]